MEQGKVQPDLYLRVRGFDYKFSAEVDLSAEELQNLLDSERIDDVRAEPPRLFTEPGGVEFWIYLIGPTVTALIAAIRILPALAKARRADITVEIDDGPQRGKRIRISTDYKAAPEAIELVEKLLNGESAQIPTHLDATPQDDGDDDPSGFEIPEVNPLAPE